MKMPNENIYKAVPGLVVTNRTQADKAIEWLYHFTERRDWNSGQKLMRLVMECRSGRLKSEPMSQEEQAHPELILLHRLLQFERTEGGAY